MIRLLTGDCRDLLPTLPADSVHCIVCSPPYYALRSYLPPDHADKHRELGSEATPDEYLTSMVAVFREVRRILRPDGVMFVNMGDGFSNKQLQMMPSRLALALQNDGWILRSMLPWLKRSAMPESVGDRPASAVEYVFLLTRSARYYWDAEAVKRAQTDNMFRKNGPGSMRTDGEKQTSPGAGVKNNSSFNANRPANFLDGGRNFRNSDLFYDSLEAAPWPAPRLRRDRIGGTSHAERGQPSEGGIVSFRSPPGAEPLGLICSEAGEPLALDVNPAAFSDAHFATFPPKLVEPLIRAGTSERGCCAQCGAPWVRSVSVEYENAGNGNNNMARKGAEFAGTGSSRPYEVRKLRHASTTGWSPGCAHDAVVVPCRVLDPFMGAGTVALVCDRLQRDAIGIELSAPYTAMAEARVVDDAPLFAWAEAQPP